MTEIEDTEIDLADILGGGLEREFAEVMTFTMTSMLKLYKRQEMLLDELKSIKPGIRDRIDGSEGGAPLGRAAAKLVEIIAFVASAEPDEDFEALWYEMALRGECLREFVALRFLVVSVGAETPSQALRRGERRLAFTKRNELAR